MAIRMNLRRTALSVVPKILGLIEKRKRGESVGTEVKSMVDNALLGDGALERFERLATEEQVSVLERWLSRMMEPELPQSLVEGAVTQALFDSEERDYRIRLRGLIAIGNVKDIGVKVRLGSVKYVRISSESPQTDVSVTGLLFALYLIDNVKVNLDFSKSMETASFAAAQND
jgi:hypothetical protein